MSLFPSNTDQTFRVEQAIAAERARKQVDEAFGAARLVGGVFIALGALVLFGTFRGGMRRGGEWLAVANAVILIGPGVWYFFAASMLRRLDPRAATAALRVAAAQGVAVAAGFAAAAAFDRNDLARMAIPAMLAVFFMPALAALAYHVWRARSAMNALGGGPLGFAPLAPRPVLPLEPQPGEGEAPAEPVFPASEEAGSAGASPSHAVASDPHGHGIDNFRGK